MADQHYLLGHSRAEEERLRNQVRELEHEARWLLDRLDIQPGARAIDLGCGLQGVLDLLAARVGPRGTVVGLGWAVLPENGTSVNGLPRVERSLDWIRLAARFPVRIKVEDPDESFRIGASAVATVQGSLRSVSR